MLPVLGSTGAKQSFVVFVVPGVSHGFLVSTSVLHTLRYHVKTQQQHAELSFSHDLSQSHKPEALSVKLFTQVKTLLCHAFSTTTKQTQNVSGSSRLHLKQAKTCTVTPTASRHTSLQLKHFKRLSYLKATPVEPPRQNYRVPTTHTTLSQHAGQQS